MRLLLDAHVSPTLARRLRDDGIDVVAVRDWRDGAFRTASDDALLAEAAQDLRVLVTFDLRTIPVLLKTWAEAGRHHGGVVLVDDATLHPADIGRLRSAIRALHAQATDGNWDWTDRVIFLRTT